jgi:hypothetical protein
MPRPYGGDRLEALPEGRLELLCREPKGWAARQKARAHHHRDDHPGTAVLWEDAHWEVLAAETRPDGSVRYVLAPWDTQNIFRGMVAYDDASEEARGETRRRERKAAGQRTILALFAPFAGILPEEDQVALESRLGVPAFWMTFLSAVILLMFGTFSVIALIATALGPGVRIDVPLGVLLLGDYLFMESFARLIVVMAQGRPIGSLLTLPWVVWKALRAPKRAPLAGPDARELAEERVRTFHALKPVLALLPAADQERLHQRYAFEYLSWGRTTASVLSVVGSLFAGSAVLNILAGARDPGELLWLLAGILILAEQIGRFAEMRAGRPAGSVLGRGVKRFARPLLEESSV